ncbi:MAG: pentapeptide repeat-containing protein [Alphaproteobacteria bacterium]|nr:pentapeptide repeat-containing protein [Alphaproteobacteria bacterium]MDE2630281.1 pentapeptide repeat-containing protein [Alphaproteobacteria bacterium]
MLRLAAAGLALAAFAANPAYGQETQIVNLAAFAATANSQGTQTAYLDAVASIKAGHHDCPYCVLAGADLANTCVKGGNLRGADFDNARLVLMCMSFADFRGATFRRADLSGANLASADLDGADLTGANMTITSIKGADLTHVRGLTQKQLDAACGDTDTKVPSGMKVQTCS